METHLSRYSNKAIDIQGTYSGHTRNGSDDLFSNYLNGLYNNSPTNQCVIDDLTGYIVAQGLVSDNPTDEPKIKHFLNKQFLNDLERYRKIQNTSCILVQRNVLHRIIKIEVINPAQIRVGQMKDGHIHSFKYKKTWDGAVNSNYRAEITIPAYDKYSPQSLIYWYDSGTFDIPYGRPSYNSGRDAIEFEIGLYMGDNHASQNGLTPSAVITLPSSGDEEKDKKAVDAINANLAGIANKGKVATIHTKAGETTPPTITLLNDNSTESKKVNYEVAEAGILKAWRIPSPTLISGMNVKSSGFSSPDEEMQWALNTLKSKIIEPNRTDLLDILKPLFIELDITGNVIFLDETEKNAIVQEEVSAEIVNDNIKNLTGKQFQGIERIVRKFKKGQITKDQAKLTLRGGFGFSDEEAETWLAEDFTKLSSEMSFDDIIQIGETIEDFEGWEIESIEEAESKETEVAFLNTVKLASTGTAFPNAKSSQDGTAGVWQYKIRYRYSGSLEGERSFCNKMLNAKKLYRFEDIERMSTSSVNAGFGIRGAANYDIFSYKGGPNCKHKWERITFVKRGFKGGIDVKSPLAKTLTESQADNQDIDTTGEAKSNQRKSETTPYNMPGHGYFKFKSIINKLKNYING